MEQNCKKIIADWHQKMMAIKAEKRKNRDEQKLIIFEYYPELPSVINYIRSEFSHGKLFFPQAELINLLRDKNSEMSSQKLKRYMIKILKALQKTGSCEYGITVNEKINSIKIYERPPIRKPIAVRPLSKKLWADSNLVMKTRNCQKCGIVLSDDEENLCLLCDEKSSDEKRESEEDIENSKKSEKW